MAAFPELKLDTAAAAELWRQLADASAGYN